MKVVNKIDEIIECLQEIKKNYEELNVAIDKCSPAIIDLSKEQKKLYNKLYSLLKEKDVLHQKLMDDWLSRIRSIK